MAGIISGNGGKSGGRYAGIAPESRAAGVKILDGDGNGDASDVLAGIQWVISNKEKYNLRVMNLSVGMPDTGSASPLVKAVETAWDMGIVVCAAAGNNGPREGTVTSPGISRKIITVGSWDDDKPIGMNGRLTPRFSGRGPTRECVCKPDIIAPGAGIVSCLCRTPNLKASGASKVISRDYVSMSGTSMSTPMVSGAAALVLSLCPALSPNDVKYLLLKSAADMRYPRSKQGRGALDAAALLRLAMEGVRVEKEVKSGR